MILRLDISYRGTAFVGWQSQPNGNAIQDHLNDALKVVFRQSCKSVGASRTDSGVHALQQVVRVDVPGLDRARLDLVKARTSLDALLGPEITVYSLTIAEPEFHPLAIPSQKTYCYRLWQGKEVNPLCRPYVWSIPKLKDLSRFIRDLEEAVGYHDFVSFCAADSSAKSTERKIDTIKVAARGAVVEIWISGNGFLKQMVRSLVGTAVDLNMNRLSRMASIGDVIRAKDRRLAGRTAPASGLMLSRIKLENQVEPEAVHHFLASNLSLESLN